MTKSPELLVRVRRCYDRMVGRGAGAAGAAEAGSLEEAVRRAQADEAEATGRLDVGDRDVLGEVPESFAEVEARHFPLFLTFEKATAMLERAYRDASRHPADGGATDDDGAVVSADAEGWMEQGRTWATGEGGRRLGLLSVSDRCVWARAAAEPSRAEWVPDEACAAKGRMVDFDRFAEVYWPHMDEALRSRFEPHLVWAEIQSLIKGCEDASRAGAEGGLSLAEYESLSGRRYPAFSHSRERLYRLYEKYERRKRQLRDHDSMDRIRAILALRERLGPAGGPRLPLADELYVDEVQDLAPAMMRLLLGLLRQPGGFLMACGDTAQTIAKGSLFRFEDLSALVFRELAAADPLGARLAEARLAHNYRSHNGILRLAASVVDLLYTYFPESVDRMERDRSDEDGCLPIVWRPAAFLDCLGGEEQGWTALFAGGAGVPGAAIEFGAEQAILVRGEATKARIMELEQRPGFVGTVFDAKGEPCVENSAKLRATVT